MHPKSMFMARENVRDKSLETVINDIQRTFPKSDPQDIPFYLFDLPIIEYSHRDGTSSSKLSHKQHPTHPNGPAVSQPWILLLPSLLPPETLLASNPPLTACM